VRKTLFYYFKILILAFVVCLPIILPYFKAGFFPTHDGEWAVVRLGDMYREIKDLQFPARFSGYLNFEYGYPLFNFAYPMPYYLGVFFVFLKSGFVNSIKILFALSAILSFFFMFLLSKSLWKNKWAGFASAVLYIYVPYRIVDLYIRGSIGESLSFVFFPLILLGILKIYEKKNVPGSILFTGFFYGFLVTTHNIMAVLFSIIIFFVCIVSSFKKQLKFIVSLGLSIIYALGLSAFFWIPAIFEKNLILLSKIPIADRSIYFVKPAQLIVEKWGYGTPTDASGFGYQLGLPQLAILFLVLVVALVKIKNRDSKTALFLAISSLMIAFLLFSPSSFIWSHIPLLSEINYPWTVLSVLVLLISLMAGYLTKLGKYFISIVLIICLFAVILIIPHAKPQAAVNRGDSFYITNQATTTSSNELMPLWVKKLPFQKAESKVNLESGKIKNFSFNSRKISFSIDSPKSQKITINTIYYPGWKLKIDGKETPINYSNEMGLIQFNVNSGSHLVKAQFTETPLRFIADLISAVFILFMVLILIFGSRLKSLRFLLI
jgi:hypothetical protein